MAVASEWVGIASRHQAEQQEAIPREWILPHGQLEKLRGTGTSNEGRLISLDVSRKSKILTDKEYEITEAYGARQLLDKIHTGKLTSEEVTVAFCKRAALAQQLVGDSLYFF